MNDRIGLLTLAAYMTATMLIVVAAFWGIFRYGTSSRIPSLESLPTEPMPELAATGLPLTGEDAPARGRLANGLDRQRVRFLESMLIEKTTLIRQQAGQIEEQTTDLKELKQRYDETMLMAIESLPGDSLAGTSSPAGDTPTAVADTTPDDATRSDPDQWEAELMLARAVHDALVSDLEMLQDELDKAYEQLEKTQEDADKTLSDRLKDTLVLEDVAAGVVAQAGKDAVPALVAALTHRKPVVRRWAAAALAELGSDASDATEALAEALTDDDPDVRRAAKAALDAIEQ